MVAIFSSSGAGLGLATTSTLGLGGAFGQTGLGKTGEQAYLNIGNGNLVLRDQDAFVESTGLDMSVLRTYNASGGWNDDNGDGWMLSVYRNIGNLTGTANTAGSTVQRVGPDGTVVTYNYDAAQQLYVAGIGTGDVDTLAYNSASQSWTWTDAATQNKEVYQANGARWRLATQTDANGNQISYSYNGNLIASVTDASGDKIVFTHSGNNLTQESVVGADGTALKTTYYTYDTSNRLQQVKVDLSPSDNSIADGKVYVTSYAYQGSTNLLSSLQQSDGTQLSLSWTSVGGVMGLSSITDALGRVTNIAYDTTAQSATITDALSNQYVFKYDASAGKRLVQASGPAVNGSSRLYQYEYDAFGHVTKVTDAAGKQTLYTYDTRGNVLSVTDPLGDRTEYTYTAANQVATVTRYRTPVNGATAAADPETTRYVYDANGNVRFAVSAEGDVTEYRYDSRGQRTAAITYPAVPYSVSGLGVNQVPTLAQMTTWSGAQSKASTTLVEYSYDVRGQLQQVTAYSSVAADGTGVAAGKSVTSYAYDVFGNLLMTIDGNNHQTSYTYDGLNRLLTSVDALGHTELYQYDDANHKIVHTLANGRVDTAIYDADGELLSTVSGGQAQMTYQYDALGRLVVSTDATGVKQYYVYDAAGNLQASVDGNGAVVRYVYNSLGQRVQTIHQATALTAAQISALPQSITYTSSAADQISWSLYDAAGRLVKTLDPAGALTDYQYDGAGNLVAKIRRYRGINTATLSSTPTLQDLTVAAYAAGDRSTTFYYDHDNQLVGTIDGEGYVTQMRYDAAGRMVETIAYATAVTGASGTSVFSTLIPATNAADQHSYQIYDGQGRVVGTINAEGYLTESTYDAAGNLVQARRYANKVSAAVNSGATLASVRPATSAKDQVNVNAYDVLNRIQSSTNAEGTVTQYAYDVMGNVISVTVAGGTGDARQLNERYDQFGRVTATLSGLGSALLNAGMTQAQIDAIWAQYGTTYTYDAAGRRSSMTDAVGNRTLFYYDKDGHLTQTINGLGEVQENQYNALGELTATVEYGARLSSLSGLVGGLVTSALTTSLAQIANSTRDHKVSYNYDLRGTVVSQIIDPVNSYISFGYNIFGEKVSRNEHVTPSTYKGYNYTYDRRGLMLSAAEDSRNGGILANTQTQYDAFGRVVSRTDPNGNVTRQSYDRLGQVIAITDATNAQRTTTYDAFGRVLTQTDALGHAITYSYDDASRTSTLTSAEGVTMTVKHNAEGQTQSITDGNGNVTSYTYDADGNLLSTGTALGTVSNQYDRADHLIQTTDANGNVIAYTYDAAGRVLTRTVDPNGLALATTYQYDARGEVMTVTDAKGIVTAYTYDLDGKVLTQVVDPSGLNAKTSYVYDQQDKLISVTSPAGTVTTYTYDNLGHRLSQTTDANGLALTTNYSYDKVGNVLSRTDGTGNVTRYVYDADNRLVYTIDAAGDVQKNSYDADGNVVAQTAYANVINPGSLSATPTLAEVAALVVTSSRDTTDYRVYNKDGQVTYTVDGTGAVTAYSYDGNGNVVDKVTYANRINLATWTPGTAPAVTANATYDARLHTVYNARNQAIYSVNGVGAVTAYKYDANGNVIDRVTYATVIALSAATDAAHIATAVAAVADATRDVHVRMVYDANNRLTWQANGVGAVTQYVYDKDGNVVKQVAYATAIGASASPSSAVANANDHVSLFVYDNLGRAIYSVDALGQVVKNAYDANGNLVRSTRYAAAIAAPTTSSAAPTATAVAAAIQADAANDRVGTWVYDTANRLSYAIDSLGDVTETRYDGAGRVVANIAYATPLTATALSSLSVPATRATVSGLVQADGSHDRLTQYAYDAAGRQVYVVDPLGYVRKTAYDALGRIIATTSYANAVNVPVGASLATIAAALVPSATLDETDSFTYDAEGHLLSSTDALGHSETFIYNGIGEKISFKNKNGNTWTYIYDAAGRLVTQTAPSVSVTNVTTDANGNLVAGATTSAAVLTVFAYDALGNLIRQTEAAGQTGQRVTTYKYDALGRQVAVFYPNVGVYSASADNLATNGANGLATRTETSVQPSTQVTYDVFGNAVANRDVNGHYSYKAYDKDGQLLYDVDAAGYVTGYVRNAFGDSVSLTRYATAPTLSTSGATAPTAAQLKTALQAVAGSKDRTLVYTVDRLGRTTQATQPQSWLSNGTQSVSAAAVTRTSYDAFGQTVQTSTLADAVNNTWATTTNYYDKDGRNVASIDAMGYLTTRVFDANGNLLQQTDYATATTGWSATSYTAPAVNANDRVVAYTYDQENRKTSQTYVNTTYSTAAGVRGTGNITTTYGYDAVGNQTVLVDPNGGVTYTYYDALGRVAAVSQPVVSATQGGAALTPLTVYKRDALGNVMLQVQYANGAASASATGYTAAATSSADRTTLYSYDLRGNVIETTNANGVSQFASYDAAGELMKTWQGVTGNDGVTHTLFTAYQYDAVGHQINKITAGSNVVVDGNGNIGTIAQSAATLVQSQSQYNAFGELVKQGTNGVWQVYYDYDNAGHLWHTNSGDGVDKVMLYNAMGAQVSLITSAGAGAAASLNLGNGVNLANVTSAQQVEQMAGIRRVDNTVDLLGRSVSVALAQRDGSRPVVQQSFDRWGNVISRSTMNGLNSVSVYAYDAFNHLITQTDPDTNGAQSAGSPVIQVYYDKLGRQIGLKDANGNLTTRVYDAAGNVSQELHADGGVINSYYDIFGQKVVAVDAMGNRVSYVYDKLGRSLQSVSDTVTVSKLYGPGIVLINRSLVTNSKYDEAGRLLWTQDPAGNTTLYAYDLRGNQTSKTMPLGQVETYAYDAQGKQIAYRDANGNTATWTYDYFGLLQGHKDIGGAVYSYTYDADRQLVQQTNTRGQNIVTRYDGAGQVIQVKDLALNQVTLYSYNIAGQHIREQTIQDGKSYQDNWLAYDAAGRLARVDSPDDGITVINAYDKVGNLIHQQTIQQAESAATTSKQVVIDGVSTAIAHDVIAASADTQDLWYAYDSMQRQILIEGAVDGNVANTANVTSTQGHIVTYDKNGNRLSDTSWGRMIVPQITASGNTSYVDHTGMITQYYDYDKAGRLNSVMLGAFDSAWHPSTALSDAVVIKQYYYDANGNIVQEGADDQMDGNYRAAVSSSADLSSSMSTTRRTYDANGRLLTERVLELDDSLRSSSDYTAAGSYDAEGNVLAYTVTTPTFVQQVTETYIKNEGYLRSQLVNTTTKTGQAAVVDTTVSTFNVNGILASTSQTASAGATPVVTQYFRDMAGNMLQSVAGNKITKHLEINDQVLAAWSSGGASAPTGPTDAHTPRVEGYDESGNASIRVQAGDTLQSLAQMAYGDSKLWYVIADANGLANNTDLVQGSYISIPTMVGSTLLHTDNSWSGQTTSTNTNFWDVVPGSGGGGGGGCGGLGSIVMVVVAVVATIYTAGAASALLGAAAGTVTAAGAAIGAAVGSIASQAVGIAIGAQDGFSWKQVGIAAVSAGITQGVSGAIGGGVSSAIGGTTGQIAGAVVSNVVSQGIGVAVGLQHSFSWTSVAAAGVSAGVQTGISSYTKDSTDLLGQAQTASNTDVNWTRLAGGLVASAVSGGRASAIQALGDAFGNALGNSLKVKILQGSQQEQQLQQQENARDAAIANAFGVSGSSKAPVAIGALGGNRTAEMNETEKVDARALELARLDGQATAELGLHGSLSMVPAQPVSASESGSFVNNTSLNVVGQTIDGGLRWSTGPISYPVDLSSPDVRMLPSLDSGSIQAAPSYLATLQNIYNSDLPVSQKMGMAWDNTKFYYQGSQRAQGIAQSAGGALEMVGAGALSEVPPVAAIVGLHGYDNLTTGINRIFTGNPENTTTYNVANGITGSSQFASDVEKGIGFMGLVGGAGATVNGATTVQWKYFYRGDETARTDFLSSMAQERGVPATNEFLDSHVAVGFKDIYEEHGVSSQGLPTIGVTDNLAVAEYFARGPSQNQSGFVTTFRLKESDASKFAFPNYENPRAFFEPNPDIGSPEREYLFHTEIDPKFVVQQVQVGPK